MFANFSSIFLQVVEPCMVDVIKASSPVPKLFQFFAALQYQLHVFLKKADLCPHIPYDELKSIALESGKINYAILLKETNLPLRLCAWSFANTRI